MTGPKGPVFFFGATISLVRAVPPLPLAGEGWGEGNLVEALHGFALTLPSPASGRGKKSRGAGSYSLRINSGISGSLRTRTVVAA